MKVILVTYLQIGFLIILNAQSGYYYYTIDLRHPQNSLLVPAQTENPGMILLNGFSKGKIKAYKSAYIEEPIEWSNPESLDEWESNKNYYFEDMVRYNGADYVVTMESKGKPPGDNNYWAQIDRRVPVKYKYELPALRDTLSKEQFLRNMVWMPEQAVQEWTKGTSYFITDLAWYNGYVYEAIEENIGIPPTDINYWQKTHRADLQFAQPNEIQVVQILYYYKVINSDTMRIPQMFSLFLAGYEGNKNVASFYYKDAIDYLSSVRSPIVYRSKFGYFKNQFLPCTECKYDLAAFIRENLRTGRLTQNPQDIINKPLHDQWTADDNLSALEAFQLPGGNEIFLYGSKIISETESIPDLVAKMDVSKIITLLPNYLDEYYSYAFAFQHQMFDGARTKIDSLLIAPIENSRLITQKTPSKAQSYINYSANLSDLKIEHVEVIGEVWKKITATGSSGNRLPLTQLLLEFFPLEFDWKKIQNWRSSENSATQFNFSSSPFQINYTPDSIPDCSDIVKFSVCYKKTFDLTTHAIETEPTYINFEVRCDESERARMYSFKYSDIEEILNSNQLFLQDIKGLDFKWNNAELIYGLIEGDE
jgi:hypothetical protein